MCIVASTSERVIDQPSSPSSKKHSGVEFEPARTLWAGMQKARRRGDVIVPQGRPAQGQECAADGFGQQHLAHNAALAHD